VRRLRDGGLPGPQKRGTWGTQRFGWGRVECGILNDTCEAAGALEFAAKVEDAGFLLDLGDEEAEGREVDFAGVVRPGSGVEAVDEGVVVGLRGKERFNV
jgi:hypothetical protein